MLPGPRPANRASLRPRSQLRQPVVKSIAEIRMRCRGAGEPPAPRPSIAYSDQTFHVVRTKRHSPAEVDL